MGESENRKTIILNKLNELLIGVEDIIENLITEKININELEIKHLKSKSNKHLIKHHEYVKLHAFNKKYYCNIEYFRSILNMLKDHLTNITMSNDISDKKYEKLVNNFKTINNEIDNYNNCNNK